MVPEDKEDKVVDSSPITGLVTALQDTITPLADGHIAWSTYWQLCWKRNTQAQAYPLRVLTSEGASGKILQQTDTCYRIQVAAGLNQPDQGMLNRDMLLALQSGNLSYQVRAVLNKDKQEFGEWSVVVVLDPAE